MNTMLMTLTGSKRATNKALDETKAFADDLASIIEVAIVKSLFSQTIVLEVWADTFEGHEATYLYLCSREGIQVNAS